MIDDRAKHPQFGRQPSPSTSGGSAVVAVLSSVLAFVSALAWLGIWGPYLVSARKLHYEHNAYAPDSIVLQGKASDHAVWFLLFGTAGVGIAVLWGIGGVMLLTRRNSGRLLLIGLGVVALIVTVLGAAWAATRGGHPEGAVVGAIVGLGWWGSLLLLLLLPTSRRWIKGRGRR